MKLYEINKAIEDCVDKETGEILDEAALDALQIEREEKIHNIAAYIINLKAMEAAAKERKDRFAAKEKAARNKREALKAYLDRQLAGKKWSDDDFNIYWTKSEKTDVYDEDAVPVDYKIPQPYMLDTMGIKRTLKMGKSVPGARIVEMQNIQVK